MNTTNPPTPSAPDDDVTDPLEALAAADPGDAPDAAEALAADLAGELEAVAPHSRPEQLEAAFEDGEERSP